MDIDKLCKTYRRLLHIVTHIRNNFRDLKFIEKEEKIRETSKGFKFIPFEEPRRLFEFLIQNRQNFENFCDLGCGYNHIGFISTLIGYESYGIEINSDYILFSDNVVRGNLLEQESFGQLRKDISYKSLSKKSRTIFYAYSPLLTHIPGFEGNYDSFFHNLESIMREDDIFILMAISAIEGRFYKKYFEEKREDGLLILKKKVPKSIENEQVIKVDNEDIKKSKKRASSKKQPARASS